MSLRHSLEVSSPLKPFSLDHRCNVEITATICRRGSELTVAFVMSGPLHMFSLPAAPIRSPQRLDNLWEASCFEFFIADAGSDNYCEVNISPSGNWNLYRFENYRQGRRQDENILELPCQIVTESNTLFLGTVLDLNLLGLAEKPVQVGACAVLKYADNTLSYWALAHPSSRPDFHNRQAFLVNF